MRFSKYLPHVSLSPERVSVVSPGSSQRSASKWVWQTLNYCLCTGRLGVCEILSVPVKGKVSAYYSPTSLPHVSPTGLQNQTSWGLDVLVHNLWVAVLMWGLDPSLLGENLCNCDWLSSSLWVMDQGYGSRLDWDSAPPTYLSVVPSSYILLQRIFSTISFQDILIGSCSANSCNFFLVTEGRCEVRVFLLCHFAHLSKIAIILKVILSLLSFILSQSVWAQILIVNNVPHIYVAYRVFIEKTLMLGNIEGDDREWDGWMASPTQWTWVWASSRSWWWIGKSGWLQPMGSQGVRHKWVTELNWLNSVRYYERCRKWPDYIWPSSNV